MLLYFFLMKNLLFVFLLSPLCVFAQISHTVAPKETLYGISKKYNIAPKDLAEYNHLDPNAGLNVGQVIKIPSAKKANPVSSTEPHATENFPGSPENGTPVYHKVKKKETLSVISKQYAQVPLADLKRWNHLSNDIIQEGMNLIVGYKSADAASAPKEKSTVVSKEIPDEPVKAKTSTAEIKVPVPEEKPLSIEPVKETTSVVETRKPLEGEGFFKPEFVVKSSKEESGKAAIFKSTSGWEDAKYYCLHNSAPAGSIIKMTNISNGKEVYAKVLDVIPDLKQNVGLILRISNAAAAALGVLTEVFDIKLTY